MFDFNAFFVLASHFLVEGESFLLESSLHFVSFSLSFGHLVLSPLGTDLTVLDFGGGCDHVAVVLVKVNGLLFFHLF